jgi:putative glycosyl hydrolase-like family 15 (GHL15) protein
VRSRVALVAAALTLLLMPAAASARQVGHVRVALDTNASFPDYARSADRHGYVILQAWQHDRLRALKQANPGVKVLVYKDLAFATDSASDSGQIAAGVSADEANRDHPDWFLRNTDGNRFTSESYGWQWAMDVGSAAYQRRWAANVVRELREDGWDGVFIDDVNATFRYHYEPRRIAKYPTDEAYQAAVRSALASVGPRIQGAGKLAIANIGSWAGFYETGVDWLRFLDGAMDEQFLKWGTHRDVGYDPHVWRTQVNELKAAEKMGKDFIGVTHSAPGDKRAALYGYATMLLASDGRHAHFALASDYTHETWFPEYDYDLGRPLGPARRGDDGVYRRRFQRGLVVVNPTASSKRVALKGHYGGSGVARASATRMRPTSGLVLEGSAAGGSGGSQGPGLLAIVKGGRVALRWTRGRHPIKRYRVLRNGRVVAVTRGRRFLDRRARRGRSYRYRVAALDGRGRLVARSNAVRIGPPRRGRRARASAAVRRVRAALAGPRGWKGVFVQRRVRRNGHVVWRRVTRKMRPQSSLQLAVHAPRSAILRLVVSSRRGAALRSGAFRAAG